MNVVTPDSAGLVDSSSVMADSLAEIPMPTAEQLGISITVGAKDDSGNLIPLSVTVGDTFDFPITVSWSVNGSALLVVPTSTATAKGLTQVGVSQESARMVKDGKEMASITFTYKIAAQDTGSLNVPAMRFEIPTSTGKSLDLRSDSVPVQVKEPVSALPFVVGIVVAVAVVFAGLMRARRRARTRAAEAEKNAFAEALREQMLVLKRRATVADSREWLLELEQVCKKFVAEKLLLDAEKVNLEALQKNGDLDKFGGKDGWESLLSEFAHARYGGGKRDGFENRETWKLAMKLMGIEESEE